MFCENCGAPLQDGDKFCPNCGAKMERATTAQSAPSSAYMPPTPEPQPTPYQTPHQVAAQQRVGKLYYPDPTRYTNFMGFKMMAAMNQADNTNDFE